MPPAKLSWAFAPRLIFLGSSLRPESYDSMSSTFTKKHFITRCATTLFRLPFPIALCQGGTTLRVRRMDPGTLLWAITEGRQRRAACAWLLKRLYIDAGALWHSYVAARNKVDELEMTTSPLGPRDEHLEHFADVYDETPLRKLIFQKLGTEPPPASSSPTVIANRVRSIGSVSSFRGHINKVVEDHCVEADRSTEPRPDNTVNLAPPAHEQLAARETLYGLYAALYPPDARRRALVLRGRCARDPAKLTSVDFLEIVRRANDWPAPSPIFRTLGKSPYSYIFQAPVSVAAIFMLR